MKDSISLILFFLISRVFGHGRLTEPPSRGTMWRFGYNNPINYDDHANFCGGLRTQMDNGGKCGLCGDNYKDEIKQHEAPYGKFANGIITRQYLQGGTIEVNVELTAHHRGYFIFKLCPNNNIYQDPTQECFDKYQLKIHRYGGYGHPKREYLIPGKMHYKVILYLPEEIYCEQCILQWTWVGGNNWGYDPKTGQACLGCGSRFFQEHFRACSDIRIIKKEDFSGYKSKYCQAVPPWDQVPSMEKWCDDNCFPKNPAHINCPATHCNCTKIPLHYPKSNFKNGSIYENVL